MKKKLIFAAGAMVIAAAVSAAFCLNFGQTRHDDLFEQNLDALARGENESGEYKKEPFSCSIYVGANGKIKIGGLEIHAGADGYISIDGGVSCAGGGSYMCKMVECTDVYQSIFN